ncbi:MAG: glycosyltransferase, partial [Gammaproteobacteria bacterium]|nr:glycosyltransferase [Gammaproteobacteria bacterium]
MNSEKMSNNLILNLVKHAKSSFDLTDVSDQKSLYSLTDTLLDIPGLSIDTLCQIARDKETPLEFKIAVKLFKSKMFLMENKQPVKLGVLFAMWGEQNRLLPKTGSNPNGEDSLLVKLQQLKWATQGS